jgi:hypothetical protein
MHWHSFVLYTQHLYCHIVLCIVEVIDYKNVKMSTECVYIGTCQGSCFCNSIK